MEDFTFKKITIFDKNNLRDLNKLLLKWSDRGYQMRPAYFKKFIKESHLLGAFDGKQLIGMVTVVPIYKVSGMKGGIEHVFVDEKYRGQGLGRQLMNFALDTAKKLKIKTLFLTCEPERVAANGLYQKLGFKIKETNFYYLDI